MKSLPVLFDIFNPCFKIFSGNRSYGCDMGCLDVSVGQWNRSGLDHIPFFTVLKTIR
jgi:hypothetical protein